jgi:hypothetical protein
MIMTTVLLSGFLGFVGVAFSNAHSPKKAGFVLLGFSVGPLIIALVWLVATIRSFRSGVVIKGDRLMIRRTTWTMTVPVAAIAGFDLTRNVLGYGWYAALNTVDGRTVKLPFAARSMIKASPKNRPVLALMDEMATAIGLTG